MDGTERLQQGRRAFEAHDWSEAYQHLTAAAGDSGVSGLEPDDLERLAVAAYLSGHDAESADSWTRAHRRRPRPQPARSIPPGPAHGPRD